MPDGCRLHGVNEDEVVLRWVATHQLIMGVVEQVPDSADRKDEERAQWENVTMCHCCYGPARGQGALCSKCLGGDGCEVCLRSAVC